MSRIDWKRFVPSRSQWISAGIIMTAGAVAWGVPNVFTAGTTVSADQMNQNFADLEARVASLEAKLASVSTETVNGQPVVRFTGVNLQVVNGLGTSDTTNGVGNIIVGYDEVPSGATVTCSDGAYTDQTSCVGAGEVWASVHKSGSHNVIVGGAQSYSQYGGVVSGINNTVNRGYASAIGGIGNVVSAWGGAAVGGTYNKSQGTYAVTIGGSTNTASGWESTVTGGFKNTASGTDSTVSGGSTRTASGANNWVAGGYSQTQ